MTVTFDGGPLAGQTYSLMEKSEGTVYEVDGHRYVLGANFVAKYLGPRPADAMKPVGKKYADWKP